MPAGRPTKYKPEYVQKVLDMGAGTAVDIACELGVGKSILYDWCEKYPEFSDAFELAKTRDEQKTWENALNGNYNATIAKLRLAAVHKQYEKSESKLEHTGPGGKELPPTQITIVKSKDA